jgi:hypothetical protein
VESRAVSTRGGEPGESETPLSPLRFLTNGATNRQMYRGSAPLKFDVGFCFLDQVYLFSLLLPFNPDIISISVSPSTRYLMLDT